MNSEELLPKWESTKRENIVGTAEAAKILGVERPRIGRWIKQGIMPPTAAQLKATPVWHRKDIINMKDWVESHRRQNREPKPKSIYDNLMGVAEVSDLLGVEGQRIPRWRRKGVVLPNGRRVKFPEPVRVLKATPVWERSDIERLRDALNTTATIEHL